MANSAERFNTVCIVILEIFPNKKKNDGYVKSFELNIFLETSQAVKQIDVLILLNRSVQGGLNKHWDGRRISPQN